MDVVHTRRQRRLFPFRGYKRNSHVLSNKNRQIFGFALLFNPFCILGSCFERDQLRGHMIELIGCARNFTNNALGVLNVEASILDAVDHLIDVGGVLIAGSKLSVVGKSLLRSESNGATLPRIRSLLVNPSFTRLVEGLVIQSLTGNRKLPYQRFRIRVSRLGPVAALHCFYHNGNARLANKLVVAQYRKLILIGRIQNQIAARKPCHLASLGIAVIHAERGIVLCDFCTIEVILNLVSFELVARRGLLNKFGDSLIQIVLEGFVLKLVVCLTEIKVLRANLRVKRGSNLK